MIEKAVFRMKTSLPRQRCESKLRREVAMLSWIRVNDPGEVLSGGLTWRRDV